MNRCGKPGCACKADPPKLHGPYVTWTRKVEGKTVTRRLSAEQLERYRPWFENRRRLRELTGELEALSLEGAEQAEGWAPAEPGGGGDRRHPPVRRAPSHRRARRPPATPPRA